MNLKMRSFTFPANRDQNNAHESVLNVILSAAKNLIINTNRLVLIPLIILSCGNEIKRHYPITPVPFTDVKITDSFWLPRIETNNNVTIPFAFKKIEETEDLLNEINELQQSNEAKYQNLEKALAKKQINFHSSNYKINMNIVSLLSDFDIIIDYKPELKEDFLAYFKNNIARITLFFFFTSIILVSIRNVLISNDALKTRSILYLSDSSYKLFAIFIVLFSLSMTHGPAITIIDFSFI